MLWWFRPITKMTWWRQRRRKKLIATQDCTTINISFDIEIHFRSRKLVAKPYISRGTQIHKKILIFAHDNLGKALLTLHFALCNSFANAFNANIPRRKKSITAVYIKVVDLIYFPFFSLWLLLAIQPSFIIVCMQLFCNVTLTILLCAVLCVQLQSCLKKR